MTKILYIAGYGRSGSTVLNIVLGNHSDIVGVGEVSLLLNDWIAPDHVCACGKPYDKCEFWSSLFQSPPSAKLVQSVRKIEKLSFVPCLLLGLIREDNRQVYRAYQEMLFDHIASSTGKSIIIDSSKSARYIAGRPLALKKLAGENVYVLHLVRNGINTVESLAVKGSNWAIEGLTENRKWQGIRAVLGWTIANIWASAMGRLLDADHYMLLRYEDFIAHPAATLMRIGDFCGFDAKELVERVNRDDCFKVGHLVGGNRVRLRREIRIQKSREQDQGKRLKLYHRLLFVIVARWLSRYYGYK